MVTRKYKYSVRGVYESVSVEIFKESSLVLQLRLFVGPYPRYDSISFGIISLSELNYEMKYFMNRASAILNGAPVSSIEDDERIDNQLAIF